jgi:hypothetical protein
MRKTCHSVQYAHLIAASRMLQSAGPGGLNCANLQPEFLEPLKFTSD